MNAKKTANGKYRARATAQVNGERVYKSFTADTKEQAEFLAASWATKKIRSAKNPTISEAIDAFINHREPILSPPTIRSYISMAKVIKADIGRICVSEMTSEKLQAYISKIDRAPKTVKNYSTFLIAVLNSVNPDIKYNVVLPRRTPTQYLVPDEKAVKALIENAPQDLKLAILLGAVGGLRRGEICALKQDDVLRDLHAVYIHADVVMDKNRKWIYKPTPKTSSSIRKVDLPKQIIDMIPENDGFIFPHSPNWLTQHFKRYARTMGLECRFHDLRHYCASYLHSIGVPDQYIQERCGWSSDTTLKNVYRNTLPDKVNMFAKKSNKAFENSFSDVI